MGEDDIVVIGADVSSARVAFVAANMDRSGLYMRKRTVGDRSGPDAVWVAWKVAQRYLAAIPLNKDVYVFIEDAVVGRSIASTKVQAYTNGGVQAAMFGRAKSVHLVNVKAWKKQVVGNGNASKEQVAQFIKQDWPEAFKAAKNDQDILDASAICLHGINSVRGGLVVAGEGALQE